MKPLRWWSDTDRFKFCTLYLIAVFACIFSFSAAGQTLPELVLIVVVDQLRGDYIDRMKHRFGDGGFRYLLDNGLNYSNAHFRHGSTFTATGHATIVTGGNAPEHGIIGNTWYDPVRRKPIYAVAAPGHKIVGESGEFLVGASPRNLLSSTIGDELVTASRGKSRIFSVSGKDRSAITLAGFLGKAYWYSTKSGHYVTSDYYHNNLPRWMSSWNAKDIAKVRKIFDWVLSKKRASYMFEGRDDRPEESDYFGLGRAFPHRMKDVDQSSFYQVLLATPEGDQVTLDFVKELLSSEKLGQRGYTDMLAVGFSSTDLIGHMFGPDSLEVEDNLLRLDRTLSQLFSAIEESVGLDSTLIVLTADHGVGEIPTIRAKTGQLAGVIDTENILKKVNAWGRKKSSALQDVGLALLSSNLYLDSSLLLESGWTTEKAEDFLAAKLIDIDGIARVYTRHDLEAGRLPRAVISARVARSFHPVRSGNLLLVPESGYNFVTPGIVVPASHGTPYNTDTYVPLLFTGPEIQSAAIHRRVGPEDIAPTLAAYLGIKAPDGSTGEVLKEVLSGH